MGQNVNFNARYNFQIKFTNGKKNILINIFKAFGILVHKLSCLKSKKSNKLKTFLSLKLRGSMEPELANSIINNKGSQLC
jgi:hypothetical protein